MPTTLFVVVAVVVTNASSKIRVSRFDLRLAETIQANSSIRSKYERRREIIGHTSAMMTDDGHCIGGTGPVVIISRLIDERTIIIRNTLPRLIARIADNHSTRGAIDNACTLRKAIRDGTCARAHGSNGRCVTHSRVSQK